MSTGHRVTGPQIINGALEDDLTARTTCARAQINDMIGDLDGFRLVLHDQDCVSLVAQPQQQRIHPLDVVRMEPDGRLVEYVRHVGQ